MTKTLLFVKVDCYQELDWLFTQVSLQSKVEQQDIMHLLKLK